MFFLPEKRNGPARLGTEKDVIASKRIQATPLSFFFAYLTLQTIGCLHKKNGQFSMFRKKYIKESIKPILIFSFKLW